MMNRRIREFAKAQGVKLWEIADHIGINDSNFSRKLRHELPENEQNRLLVVIATIAKKKENLHAAKNADDHRND